MGAVELILLAQEAAADPPGLAVQLTPWGVLTLAISLFTMMWRSTVNAHAQRANDWRAAAQLASTRADERDRQLWSVLSAVKDKAGTA